MFNFIYSLHSFRAVCYFLYLASVKIALIFTQVQVAADIIQKLFLIAQELPSGGRLVGLISHTSI